MYRDEYEISIWQGSAKDEFKICNIGSDKMTCSARALEPKLIQKITGENTFSFKMYKDCYDTVIKDEIYLLDANSLYLTDPNDSIYLLVKSIVEDKFIGEYSNPFLPYLVNERRVKVKWNNKWYEFVIKNVKEDSVQKSYTFECTDWAIQSLSKQGFNLEFDEKLENNQGTVWYLANQVVDNTEWTVVESQIGNEYNKEAVYDVTTQNTFNAVKLPLMESGQEIPAGDRILVFFSSVTGLQDSGTTVVQFCYNSGNPFQTDYNSQLIIDSEQKNYQVTVNYSFNSTTNIYTFMLGSDVLFEVSLSAGVSTYRAKKLVNSLKVEYDSITDKYANVLTEQAATAYPLYTLSDEPLYITINNVLYPIYKVDSNLNGGEGSTDEYYEFKDTDTNFAKYVQNLAANSAGFVNSNGWRYSHDYDPSTNKCSMDELNFTIDTAQTKSYLIIPQTRVDADHNDWIFNSSIRSSRSFVNNFINGQKYYLRFKFRDNDNADKISDLKITDYVSSDCYYPDPDGETYFTFGALEADPRSPQSEVWYRTSATCQRGKSFDSLMDAQIGLFFHTSAQIQLEEIQLFKEVLGENGQVIYPAEFDASGVIEDKYLIYNHTAAIDDELNKDQLEFVYENSVPYSESGGTRFVYATNNFEKIRTLKGRESNRFNLLQSLAETFEVWLKITIGHDENTGKILQDKDDPSKLQMYITFVDQVGEDQNIGFIYGLDLKQVQRTIDSKEIVTKTIVKNNSNKYATNGFCSIARAAENYPKTNYVLNFDYYVNQGLIDGTQLNDDLYNKETGYLSKLRSLNTQFDAAAKKLGEYQLQYDNLFSYLKVFKQYKEEAQGKAYDYKLKLLNVANIELENTERATIDTAWTELYNSDWYQTYCKDGRKTDEYRSSQDMNAWVWDDARITAEENEHKYDETITNIEDTLYGTDGLESKIATCKTEMDNLTALIGAADREFAQLYGSFIQEGTWSSEDYMNDTSYYLDALDVAYTSARPRITYSINVLRLSALPDFKNKRFSLGDIAYVEDTEFFGYVYINGNKTPYHEKVVLTELTEYLDEPSKDQFKVQNYRTQFEDLFQRITASVQSLQWNQADYGRAVGAVEKDLTINTDILQASYTKAQDLVRASLNNQVVQDATGITIINTSNPLEQSHIVAQGFFISEDGGETWRNAVSGAGIATELLTAGAIDTNRISLVDGSHELFRWDKAGINAYKSQQAGIVTNYSTFVRFDNWGIYGREGSEANYQPTSEAEIWNSANTKFALTWSGALIRGGDGTKSITIGSDPNSSEFGIHITKTVDSETKDVFYADDSGNLTLTGTIYTQSGEIGGWTIAQSALKTTNNQLYLGTAGITATINDVSRQNLVFKAGDKFGVDSQGNLYASGAYITDVAVDSLLIKDTNDKVLFNAGQNQVTIGGWNVAEKALYIDIANDKGVGLAPEGHDGYVIWAGHPSTTISTAPFRVKVDGTMYATKGEVGGFVIDDNHIYSSYDETGNKVYFGMRKNMSTSGGQVLFYAGAVNTNDPGAQEANFTVTSSGSLFCNSANITGTITANNGTFHYCTIEETCTVNGSIGTSGLKLGSNGSIQMVDGTPVLQLFNTTGVSVGYITSTVINRFYMGNNYFGITINSVNYTLSTYSTGGRTYLILIPD